MNREAVSKATEATIATIIAVCLFSAILYISLRGAIRIHDKTSIWVVYAVFFPLLFWLLMLVIHSDIEP